MVVCAVFIYFFFKSKESELSCEVDIAEYPKTVQMEIIWSIELASANM